MNKETLIRLVKYQTMMKDRLTSDVPEKHKNNPVTYKNFLNNEIRMVTLKIEELKLVLGGK